MNKISIILPVFNGQDTISECIESVKAQTFTDFECIIVNDGSTDRTLDISKKLVLDDPRFSIISQEHKGLSDARNLGLAKSSGSIIMYIDADDKALPNMMKKVVPFMESNSLDMMFFDAESININGSENMAFGEKHYFTRKMNYGISSGKKLLEQMIRNDDFVYAVFIQAIRRECIKYQFLPKSRTEDHLYTIQNLYLANKVGHLSETLYLKSCRKESITHSKKDENYAWSRIQTIRKLESFLENVKEQDKKIIYKIIDKIIRQLPFYKKYLSQKDELWLLTSSFMKQNFSYVKRILNTP